MPRLMVKSPEKSVTLSEKQRAFVDARAKGMNCTAAAQAAGYAIPKIQGYQLEKNPIVKAELKKQWALAEKAGEISKKKVLDGMLYAIDQAKLLADPSSQIAGWREIAKICGYYEPQKVKVEVSVSAKRMFSQFEALSDEELLKIAEQDIMDVDAVFTDSQSKQVEQVENIEDEEGSHGPEDSDESGASADADARA